MRVEKRDPQIGDVAVGEEARLIRLWRELTLEQKNEILATLREKVFS